MNVFCSTKYGVDNILLRGPKVKGPNSEAAENSLIYGFFAAIIF